MKHRTFQDNSYLIAESYNNIISILFISSTTILNGVDSSNRNDSKLYII